MFHAFFRVFIAFGDAHRRRIDEMKSSAGNPNLRRPGGGGGGATKATPHETSAAPSSAAADHVRSAASAGQHLGLGAAPSALPATPTPATPTDALADQDPSEQASLVEAKKAIDHLKSVTGTLPQSFAFKYRNTPIKSDHLISRHQRNGQSGHKSHFPSDINPKAVHSTEKKGGD